MKRSMQNHIFPTDDCLHSGIYSTRQKNKCVLFPFVLTFSIILTSSIFLDICTKDGYLERMLKDTI